MVHASLEVIWWKSALDRGHEVTLFNRGKTNPGLFPQLETILGDREKDVDQLAEAGRVLGGGDRRRRVSAAHRPPLRRGPESDRSRYVFISSISVYDNFRKVGIDESDPVGKIEDETIEEITGETYGPLKALCEKAVQDIYGERALIVRPGLIVGPHDPTDRFTYWPVRVARGGDVLAPQKPEAPIQVVDVRDLARFHPQTHRGECVRRLQCDRSRLRIDHRTATGSEQTGQRQQGEPSAGRASNS